nr:MAG TPA: hypothetical protein [Caudoviricetes sp.]
MAITLPLAYPNAQFFAAAIDWGQPGKAYGVDTLSTSALSIVAPVTPFSAFYFSLGH